MSQRKRHAKNPRAQAAKPPIIRLSQCMIVKNEEKNIERALSWGKGIVFEQIVVDTGSTDRTVEIAERMGAKVYHFAWINDFSAAKNYAIEQAAGNWIAFLDADEYFLPEDAEKMWRTLNDPAFYQRYQVLRCSIVNLDDENKAATVYEHERVFRKLPSIRYSGRIHERLSVFEKILVMQELRIMHTGYAKSAIREHGKTERNVNMLRAEWELDPENPDLMIYVADSLRLEPGPEHLAEAERMYLRALESPRPINPQLKQSAYVYLIPQITAENGRLEDAARLCRAAMEEFPENPDFPYFYGVILKEQRNYGAAWDCLQACEEMLNAEHIPQSTVVVGTPIKLFAELTQVAELTGNREKAIHYATLILREDKYQKGVLAPYLVMLKDSGASDDEILGLMQKLYQFENMKDKVFVLRAAKDSGNLGMAKRILELISEEEREWLAGGE